MTDLESKNLRKLIRELLDTSMIILEHPGKQWGTDEQIAFRALRKVAQNFVDSYVEEFEKRKYSFEVETLQNKKWIKEVQFVFATDLKGALLAANLFIFENEKCTPWENLKEVIE